MKHRREIYALLLVLAVVAILALTLRHETKPTPSVEGVSVGMATAEVEALVGPPDMKTEVTWMYFDGSRMDPRIVVTFDVNGRVARVTGKPTPAPSVAFGSP